MLTLSLTDTRFLVTEICCACGIEFAMPAGLQASRKQDQKEFYCPNGHPQSYRESEAARLTRELAKSKEHRAELQLALDARAEEIGRLGRSIIGLRGRLAQLARRRR